MHLKTAQKIRKKFKKICIFPDSESKIDRAPSTTVVLSWLSSAGTSQEVWSLIWHLSQALPTSPSYITLQRLLWRTTPPPRQTFKWTSPDQDNRDIVGTTCCCAAHRCWWCITWPHWYHGCSNSTTVDRPMSMETSQRHFTIVPGAFLVNVFDQESRRPWERRSIVHDQQRLFWGGWAVQARHRRYGVWFDTTPKHYRRLLRI